MQQLAKHFKIERSTNYYSNYTITQGNNAK